MSNEINESDLARECAELREALASRDRDVARLKECVDMLSAEQKQLTDAYLRLMARLPPLDGARSPTSSRSTGISRPSFARLRTHAPSPCTMPEPPAR